MLLSFSKTSLAHFPTSVYLPSEGFTVVTSCVGPWRAEVVALRPSSTHFDVLAIGDVPIVDVEEGISVVVFGHLAELRASHVAVCCQPVRCLPLAYRIDAFQGHLP